MAVKWVCLLCRYAGPISVAELMWVFSQAHESINASGLTPLQPNTQFASPFVYEVSLLDCTCSTIER